MYKRVGTERVAELSDYATAFELLIKAPLSQVDHLPIVLVIDALDEADPPEQFSSAFNSRSVKACGNKTLVLLRQCLSKLGDRVRFIITTRPDAICGQVQSVLESTFEGGILFVEPTELRQDVGATRGGVLVYNTVVKECGLPMSDQHQQASKADLYGAYSRVFKRDLGHLQPEVAASVVKLIEVILAAQEPISQSTLYEMGFGGVLEKLPGWGSLFFVYEHYVYIIHKSLADWLHNTHDTMIGELPFSIPQGHLALARHLNKSLTAPSEYAKKYLVFHFVTAPCSKERGALLDGVLMDLMFMIEVAKAGHLGRVVTSLGSMRAEEHSNTSLEVMRWLQMAIHQLERDPSPSTVAQSVWTLCPTSSQLFKSTLVLEVQGASSKIIGGTPSWGSQWAMWQVRVVTILLCSFQGLFR